MNEMLKIVSNEALKTADNMSLNYTNFILLCYVLTEAMQHSGVEHRLETKLLFQMPF